MKTKLTIVLLGISLHLNAGELIAAKQVKEISAKATASLNQEVKQDPNAQQFITGALSMMADQINEQAKNGIFLSAKLEVHFGNNAPLLRLVQPYSKEKRYVIYDEIWKQLESKGYKIENKVYGGAITDTIVRWN